MKIYSAQHRAIVEAPIMEKPDPQLYLTVKDYEVAMLTYEKRLTSYPPIPVLREHQNLFKDGQEVKEGIDYLIETVVTGGRSIKSLEGIPYDYETYTKDFALPIKQQVSEEDKEPLPQQEANRDLIEFDSMVDKIEGILYKNKTDEADEGSWIEGKDFHHVAIKIASAIQSKPSPLEALLPHQDSIKYFPMDERLKKIDAIADAVDFEYCRKYDLALQISESQLSEALAKIKSQEAEIADLRKQLKS